LIAKTKVKRSRKTKVKSKPPNGLISSSIVWKDAYPLIEETYRVDDITVKTERYSLLESESHESFLYRVIRSESLPIFMKNNLKKIKKFLEKEIQHRDKLYEKLSKEQVISFQTYFEDSNFFDKSYEDEFFNQELEKVYVTYIREYLSTGLYESRARITNRRHRKLLESHGINDRW